VLLGELGEEPERSCDDAETVHDRDATQRDSVGTEPKDDKQFG